MNKKKKNQKDNRKQHKNTRIKLNSRILIKTNKIEKNQKKTRIEQGKQRHDKDEFKNILEHQEN